MIALRHFLPLVRTAHGHSVAFERTWLRFAIQEAALRAGYASWWPVDDLVTGISLFLRNCYVKNVIDVPELEHVVRGALRDLGYKEVAALFHVIPPKREITPASSLSSESTSIELP